MAKYTVDRLLWRMLERRDISGGGTESQGITSAAKD